MVVDETVDERIDELTNMPKQTLTKDEYVYLCNKYQKYVGYDMVSDKSYEMAEDIIKNCEAWETPMVKDEYGGYLG